MADFYSKATTTQGAQYTRPESDVASCADTLATNSATARFATCWAAASGDMDPLETPWMRAGVLNSWGALVKTAHTTLLKLPGVAIDRASKALEEETNRVKETMVALNILDGTAMDALVSECEKVAKQGELLSWEASTVMGVEKFKNGPTKLSKFAIRQLKAMPNLMLNGQWL